MRRRSSISWNVFRTRNIHLIFGFKRGSFSVNKFLPSTYSTVIFCLPKRNSLLTRPKSESYVSFFYIQIVGADLGVGRGGRPPPPLVRDFFFFRKQRLSDGTSCFVTLDIFSLINITNKKIYRTLFESTTLINKLQTDKLKDATGVALVTSATVERSNSSLCFVKSGLF